MAIKGHHPLRRLRRAWAASSAAKPPTYDTVSNESARGLMDLAVAFAVPIGNGILTVENDAQAWARAVPTSRTRAAPRRKPRSA